MDLGIVGRRAAVAASSAGLGFATARAGATGLARFITGAAVPVDGGAYLGLQ